MVFYLLLLLINEVLHRRLSDFMNLYDNIIQKTQEQPNNAALVYFGFPITYGRLGALIDKTAAGLQRLGIGCGDTVSIALPSSPESIALIYALNKLGAIACTIDVRYTAEQVVSIINNTRSKLLFIMSFNLKSIANKASEMCVERIVAMRGCEIFPSQVAVWYALGERFNGRKRAFRSDKRFMSWDELVGATDNNTVTGHQWQKDEAQIIFQTSGTTGNSKSVLLTAENIEKTRLAAYQSLNEASQSDIVINLIPLFASFSFVCSIHMPLSMGMKVIIIPIWKPCNFIKIVGRYKPQHIFLVPSIWDTIYKTTGTIDLSHLKTAVVAGDVVNPTFERDINDFLKANSCRFTLTKGYGMTETAGLVAYTPQQSANKYETGFSGPMSSDYRAGIFDEEVCICPSTKFLGYYNNQEATDNLIRKHDDGLMWIHTGDTGRLDDTGNLYVVGRKKRMIVRYDGSKVFPVEIETVLLKCPEVKSCAVVGATDAAHNQSSVPVAFVVAKSDLPSEKKIQKYCKQHLPVYLQPEKIVFLKELPTTHIGKVNYAKLSEMSTTLL